MSSRPLRAASRGSALALWQTRTVLAALAQHGTTPASQSNVVARDWSSDITVIQTRGDLDQSPILVGQMEKGFFTIELEQALRAGEVDLVIHSLKDLPTTDAPGLTTRTVLPRANPADLLIVRPEFVAAGARDGLPLKPGTRVGASSLRRAAMLSAFASQAVPAPLRGNVPTRVQRLAEGRVDAIVIAAAGIERLQLNLNGFAVFELDPRRWIPAPGQGALAAQCRANDTATIAEIEALEVAACVHATTWERAFLRAIEGGCATPFGCYVLEGVAHMGEQTAAGFITRVVSLPESIGATHRHSPLEQEFAHESFIRNVIGGDYTRVPASTNDSQLARAR